MEKEVAHYIQQKSLLPQQAKVLVALSGGADSVALLRVLLALGYRCEAAHCNFLLRGEESDRDEAFVRDLCDELHVPLHVVHFDTFKEAQRKHISIEMAARELRYTWFEQLRERLDCCAIAVAHHRDDSVETFLLNLLRGTGIAGLQGIRAKNGYVVRPLLCVDRQEIEEYLKRIGQDYVTDSTNLEDEYLRNKIRLNLLPMMQGIVPNAKESVLKTAGHLSEAYDVYCHAMGEAVRRICRDGRTISIPLLLKEPSPKAVLFEILHPLGFNAAQVGDIYRSLDGQPGKFFLASGWRVIKDRESLLLEPVTEGLPPSLDMEEREYTPDFVIPRTSDIACLDADRLSLPLALRRWEHGDVFVPFGMTGKKKVSDYLIDRKFSLSQKERLWVLCSGNDIIWLVGERLDNRFRITSSTRRILIVTCKNK